MGVFHNSQLMATGLDDNICMEMTELAIIE